LGFLTKTLYTFLPAPMRATFPAHLILLDLIISDHQYKLWSSPFCNFLLSPVTSSLVGPNILLSTLFSNTLSLCSSLNVRDQVVNGSASWWNCKLGRTKAGYLKQSPILHNVQGQVKDGLK
jgi:hypothetical protein